MLPFAAAPSQSETDAANNGPFNTPLNLTRGWGDYVDQTYGKVVQPLLVGDLQTLYGFRVMDVTTSTGPSGNGNNNGNNGNGNNGNNGNNNAAPSSGPDGTTGVVVPISGIPASAPTTGSVTVPTTIAGAGGVSGTNGNGNGNSNGNCGADPNALRAFSGFIASLTPQDSSFRVITDNGAVVVSYSGCTTALASQPNYSLKVGDVVLVKGVQKAVNAFRATHFTCVAQ